MNYNETHSVVIKMYPSWEEHFVKRFFATWHVGRP